MLLELLNPRVLIEGAGLLGIWIIIFAESGLFVGFFFPGDSLLFTAGLFASQGWFNIWTLIVGSFLAAVFGDNFGYAFGARVGPTLFSKKQQNSNGLRFAVRLGPSAKIRSMPFNRDSSSATSVWLKAWSGVLRKN